MSNMRGRGEVPAHEIHVPRSLHGRNDGQLRTPWERISLGKTIGKRVPILFQGGAEATNVQPINLLEVSGDGGDEQQLCLTISPPRVVMAASTAVTLANLQQVSNDQDNREQQNNWNPGAAAPLFPGLATPLDWTESRLILEWGAGGIQETAETDVSNGLCVNLCASYVRVRAIIGGLLNAGLDGSTAVYVLSAFIGPGYPKPMNAQRTVYCGSIAGAAEAPGNAGAFAVPRFAKTVSLIAGQNGAAPELMVGTLRFWKRGDAGGNCVGNIFFNGNNVQNVKVPNGAYYFSVKSGMTNPALFAAVFDLAI